MRRALVLDEFERRVLAVLEGAGRPARELVPVSMSSLHDGPRGEVVGHWVAQKHAVVVGAWASHRVVRVTLGERRLFEGSVPLGWDTPLGWRLRPGEQLGFALGGLSDEESSGYGRAAVVLSVEAEP